jgi:hypothetical protein
MQRDATAVEAVPEFDPSCTFIPVEWRAIRRNRFGREIETRGVRLIPAEMVACSGRGRMERRAAVHPRYGRLASLPGRAATLASQARAGGHDRPARCERAC